MSDKTLHFEGHLFTPWQGQVAFAGKVENGEIYITGDYVSQIHSKYDGKQTCHRLHKVDLKYQVIVESLNAFFTERGYRHRIGSYVEKNFPLPLRLGYRTLAGLTNPNMVLGLFFVGPTTSQMNF